MTVEASALVYVASWRDIHHAAHRIASRWRGTEAARVGVYGVPRGGATIAAMVTEHMQFGTGVPLDQPAPGCLVVDDIYDSGRTLQSYFEAGHPTDAAWRKHPDEVALAPSSVPVPEQKWIVFPWETTDDLAGPEDAVVRLLEFMGEDPERDGLKDTPARVLRAWKEMTAGYTLDPAEILSRTFDEQHDEIVVLRNIAFWSTCEHHLLPFHGVAHVGYLPDKVVVGISKLARVVHCFARRLQVQERLTNQVAQAVGEHLGARGVAVYVRATHGCIGCRGVRDAGTEMVTSALTGVFMADGRARAEFFAMAGR